MFLGGDHSGIVLSVEYGMIAQQAAGPDYTRNFWAKADPFRHVRPERIHLLEHHLADVGACFEALITQPTIRKRLAQSGGLDALDDSTAAKLALFAALHDIGKVNVGFQTQIWADKDIRQERTATQSREPLPRIGSGSDGRRHQNF